MKRQPNDAFQFAVGLLARREHAQKELIQKVRQKFSELDCADEQHLLERLQSYGYQCDTRYVEMVARARTSRGYGPRYIRQYVEMRGVARDITEDVLKDYAGQWLELAIQALQKRHTPTQVMENRAKCIRFLLGRGYDPEIARQAIEESLDHHHEE